MEDKNSIIQIFGNLMKNPSLLGQSDKYQLGLTDFSSRFYRYIFAAIENLFRNGSTKILPIDISNYLDTNPAAKENFKINNGIEFLQDCEFLGNDGNFDYYYKKLKKFNLLRDLEKDGYDTKEFYCENPITDHEFEVNKRFEELEVKDILDSVKRNILGLERTYNSQDVTEVQSAYEGINEIFENIEAGADIGLPLQGEIFSEITAGARTGAFYLRSAASGVGKTRQAVGDACYLAYPIRYNWDKAEWEKSGSCEKVLFIATEQDFNEIRKMILAYITGITETKFRYGNFSSKEEKVISQAIDLMGEFKDNLYIVRMPNPTIEGVKMIVRENCLTKDIKYVFYDYIFISPSMLQEFKGFGLRNDEVLLMFATALKDLAVELGVFVMSSTQLNANGDNNQNIRNEAALAGGRATINKADVGAIIARPTKEELETFMEDGNIPFIPNMVTDIYKVRSGQYTQVRIWSSVELGTLRKQDLFVTDAHLDVIPINYSGVKVENWDSDYSNYLSERVRKLNEL